MMRRSFLGLLGLAPFAGAHPTPQQPMSALDAIISMPASANGFSSLAYNERIAALLNDEKYADRLRTTLIESERQDQEEDYNRLPADIASKRSWSPAFKALQHRRRIVERKLAGKTEGWNALDLLFDEVKKDNTRKFTK